MSARTVKASVLLDTDCTTIVVRRRLVRDEQLTGEFRYYRMLDGTVRRAAVAVVDIETPFISGKLPCLCIDTCDVIVANVSSTDSDEVGDFNAVTTRAKALAEGKPPRRHPLVVPRFRIYE